MLMIMTSRSHQRLKAWLGLIAMWLVVAGPTASRLLYTSHDLAVPVCSAEAGTQHHSLPVYHIHVGGQHDSPSPLEACGYCSLFAHSTAMPSVPPAALALLLALIPLAVPRRARFTPSSLFPSGRPRDPPRLSRH